MPELPEVEVARRDLEREIAGRKFKSIEVGEKRTVGRHKTKADYANMLEGRKVKSFDRRGRFIIGKLDTNELWVIYMGNAGYLRRVKAGKPEPTSETKVEFTFTQGGGLQLADRRNSVDTFVTTKDGLAEVDEYAELGLDPLEAAVPWQTFGRTLLRHPTTKLKSLLLNPRVVAGLGAVYSDEILFDAGLLYDRMPNSLSSHEVRRLYRGMLEILGNAIKRRGTSLDEADLDMFGERGEFGGELRVFQRYGETCVRCRGTIDRVKFQKRYHFYCPDCQS